MARVRIVQSDAAHAKNRLLSERAPFLCAHPSARPPGAAAPLLPSHPLEQQTQGCPRPSWHRRAAGGPWPCSVPAGLGAPRCTEDGGSSWPPCCTGADRAPSWQGAAGWCAGKSNQAIMWQSLAAALKGERGFGTRIRVCIKVRGSRTSSGAFRRRCSSRC